MDQINIRNPRYNTHGTIDCEIEHPVYGWIPFTASPDDPESIGRELHVSIAAGDAGKIAAAPPPPEPTEEDLREAARRQVAQNYRIAPPATDAGRIEALEIIMGLRDPVIDPGAKERARDP